jgi:hypothetical protein
MLKLFKSKENRAVDELIEEQKNTESVEVYRRAFCIQTASYLDETRPENLIATAERIYRYVYEGRTC